MPLPTRNRTNKPLSHEQQQTEQQLRQEFLESKVQQEFLLTKLLPSALCKLQLQCHQLLQQLIKHQRMTNQWPELYPADDGHWNECKRQLSNCLNRLQTLNSAHPAQHTHEETCAELQTISTKLQKVSAELPPALEPLEHQASQTVYLKIEGQLQNMLDYFRRDPSGQWQAKICFYHELLDNLQDARLDLAHIQQQIRRGIQQFSTPWGHNPFTRQLEQLQNTLYLRNAGPHRLNLIQPWLSSQPFRAIIKQHAEEIRTLHFQQALNALANYLSNPGQNQHAQKMQHYQSLLSAIADKQPFKADRLLLQGIKDYRGWHHQGRYAQLLQQLLSPPGDSLSTFTLPASQLATAELTRLLNKPAPKAEVTQHLHYRH